MKTKCHIWTFVYFQFLYRYCGYKTFYAPLPANGPWQNRPVSTTNKGNVKKNGMGKCQPKFYEWFWQPKRHWQLYSSNSQCPKRWLCFLQLSLRLATMSIFSETKNRRKADTLSLCGVLYLYFLLGEVDKHAVRRTSLVQLSAWPNRALQNWRSSVKTTKCKNGVKCFLVAVFFP